MAKTTEEKIMTVREKNTFWYYNQEFEETYEGHINSLKENLLLLRNRVQNNGLSEELIADFLYSQGKNGLKSLLALTGFSNEYLKRLVTFIRIVDDSELNALVYKDRWLQDEMTRADGIQEWSDTRIQKEIVRNEFFRRGIVRVFFQGSTTTIFSKALPLFHLKKLSLSKLNFEVEALLDTLVRYKEGGSYSGKKGNNPEQIIERVLAKIGVGYEAGDLGELIDNAPDAKRRMDFIIPSKHCPKVVIESSYLATTSSGQGDKSKTEISIGDLLSVHYPIVHFWGFVDGIGWYVRKQDLRRMVNAYEDVFTYHERELDRFKHSLQEVL